MRPSGRCISCTWLLSTLAAAVFASQTTVYAQLSQTRDSVTFTFPGGTLKEYVELTKETFEDDLKIILAPEVEDLKIESVEFKGASASRVLGLVRQLAHGEFEIHSFGGGVGGGGFSFVEDQIWRISPPPYTTRVFSVRDFINDKSSASQEDAMKALLSAIEATLAIGSHSKPDVKIKLHPDTGLLLISGTQEQVNIVEQVVSQLHGAQRASNKTVQDLYAQMKTLEEELRNLRSELGEKRQSGAGSGN